MTLMSRLNHQAAVLERHARPESPDSPPPGPAAPPSPETVTPLKPSEALRLGRLTRPRRVRHRTFDGPDAACAVGAMAVGAGIEELDGNYSQLEERFPGLDVAGVWMRNDRGASDAEIIAWLEGLGL